MPDNPVDVDIPPLPPKIEEMPPAPGVPGVPTGATPVLLVPNRVPKNVPIAAPAAAPLTGGVATPPAATVLYDPSVFCTTCGGAMTGITDDGNEFDGSGGT